MLPKDHDGVIICGKRKKGKTTLLRQLLEGEPRVVLYDAKGALKEPHKFEAGQDFIPPPAKGVFRAYVPTRGNFAQELEFAAYLAMSTGRCIFVVDELPDALEDASPGECFKWVTRMGRERAIRFVYSFQRPNEVPPMARAQASDWYLHQTNERTDLSYIKDSVTSEAVITVRNLQVGESLHVKDGTVVGVMRSENRG
jgi:hypothetical protein